jgi:putative transposase
VEAENEIMSVRKQCRLIALARSSYYSQDLGFGSHELEIMLAIDKIYIERPFFGSRRMVQELQRKGYEIGRSKVRRLMRLMGLRAIYPKKRLSIPGKKHKIYPYLLRGMKIERADQVWSADITYIPMRHGFVYLVAVIDWYSRYVLSWRVSTTLEADFCVEALEEALAKGTPEYFNTDQGSQFTCDSFIGVLKSRKTIRISMDGKGRVFDNIFIERLWRTLKQEEVYLKEYDNVKDCKNGLREYFRFYNSQRPHQALNYRTPEAVYLGQLARSAS